MSFNLIKIEVGPWPMNCYVFVCNQTKSSAIFDPGADHEKILSVAQDTKIKAIILTHGHADHIGALSPIKEATSAPVLISPVDASHFDIAFDHAILHGEKIYIGNCEILPSHTPGHTPGQTSFYLGQNKMIVGDTVFVGGPGRTWTPEDFSTTMKTMQEIVFKWSDETIFYPGHGPSGIIGRERPKYESFVKMGWPEDLHGDVTWS